MATKLKKKSENWEVEITEAVCDMHMKRLKKKTGDPLLLKPTSTRFPNAYVRHRVLNIYELIVKYDITWLKFKI